MGGLCLVVREELPGTYKVKGCVRPDGLLDSTLVSDRGGTSHEQNGYDAAPSLTEFAPRCALRRVAAQTRVFRFSPAGPSDFGRESRP